MPEIILVKQVAKHRNTKTELALCSSLQENNLQHCEVK